MGIYGARKMTNTSDKSPSYLMKRVEDILMKRYAVEKFIGLKEFFCIMVFSLISFLVFQGAWIIISIWGDNIFKKFLVVMAALFILILFWGYAWKIIGKIIPKFVLIGMLGWIFIIVNITPNLIIGDKWGVKKEIACMQIKNGTHSISLPLNRLLNLNENETKMTDGDSTPQLNYIESFFLPILILNNKQIHPGKRKVLNIVNNSQFRVYFYIHIGLCVFFYSMLFFTITTYKKRDVSSGNFLFLYSTNHLQREKNTELYLYMTILLSLNIAYYSLNYFILFWVITFMASIFLFRWEIKESGKSHKLLSRSVLFVILAQIFSSITGEILFLVLLPIYTDIGKGYKLFNLYDSIVLGWLIFLGSAVTVLIGIVTQVVWSGKRMTEKIRT
jgi:hypothetical protein